MKEETAVELDAINYSEMDGFTPIAIFTMKDENDRPDFPTELVSASLEAEEECGFRRLHRILILVAPGLRRGSWPSKNRGR